MAADVLTYNALAEINQELRAESVGLTSAITLALEDICGGGPAGAGPGPRHHQLLLRHGLALCLSSLYQVQERRDA